MNVLFWRNVFAQIIFLWRKKSQHEIVKTSVVNIDPPDIILQMVSVFRQFLLTYMIIIIDIYNIFDNTLIFKRFICKFAT